MIDRITADITQSTGHSVIFITDATQSTGHSAISDTDVTQSTGHSATTNLIAQGTGHSAPKAVNGCRNADFTDLMDGLVARLKSLKISKGFEAYLPASWPIKQDMYVGMDISPERYVENLHLLGDAWVQKVQHVARMTLNSPDGPKWPTEVEPLALILFEYLRRQPVDWASIRDRADWAEELDFVWRQSPPWLHPKHTEVFVPVWENYTGMARTWGWNWHNEARKRGAPMNVCKREERHPRSRFYQNKTSQAKHHHVLAHQRVPTVAQYIRTNKFYQVGDDETACERPQSSGRCRTRCYHKEDAHLLKRLKKDCGLISAPGVEPENEYGGIE